jgi:hypothetical protein
VAGEIGEVEWSGVCFGCVDAVVILVAGKKYRAKEFVVTFGKGMEREREGTSGGETEIIGYKQESQSEC